MPSIEDTRIIAAPAERVFQTVAHVREFAKVQPQITDIEFLTPQQIGVGTRFRETRLMNNRKASTVLEVTEYVENQRVRFVAGAGGTIWDTLFTVRPQPDGRSTELRMVMEAKAHKLLAKIFNPLLMGMVRKAVVSDMERVQAHCEKNAGN